MHPQFTASDVARFWSYVDKSGECWLWLARREKHGGYGAFWLDGRRWKAHRLSFFLATGALDPALEIRHACDNPPCVNPAHLLQGTHRDNMRDMIERGRNTMIHPVYGDRNGSRTHPERLARGAAHNSKTKPETVLRGERHGEAKLLDSDVRAIRQRYSQGGVSLTHLAKEYGVSSTQIWNIVRGKQWTHLLTIPSS